MEGADFEGTVDESEGTLVLGSQNAGLAVPDGCGGLYTLLEERGIKVLDNEAEEDASLDVNNILPGSGGENAEANSDETGPGC